MKLERISQNEQGTLFRITLTGVSVADIRKARAYDPGSVVLVDSETNAPVFAVRADAKITTATASGANIAQANINEDIQFTLTSKETDALVRDAQVQRIFNSLKTVAANVKTVVAEMKKVEIKDV